MSNPTELLPLDSDNAWPTTDVLRRLIWATEYLLDAKNYDGAGHEELSLCVKRGKDILARIEHPAPPPQAGAPYDQGKLKLGTLEEEDAYETWRQESVYKQAGAEDAEPSRLKRLFKLLDEQHGLTLLDSDLNDIVYCVLGKEQYLKEANAPDKTDAADFLEAEMKKSYEANYHVREKNNRPLHLKKWMFDKFVQIMQSYARHIAAKAVKQYADENARPLVIASDNATEILVGKAIRKAVEDRDKELTRLVDEAHKDAEVRRDEATVNLEVHHQQGEMFAYKQVRKWLNPTV